MKKHLSAFERGRRIVVAMIAITILLSAATLLFTEDGSTERMVLTLALSYSGRWDLTQATQRMAQDVAQGKLKAAAAHTAANGS